MSFVTAGLGMTSGPFSLFILVTFFSLRCAFTEWLHLSVTFPEI